MRCVGFYSAPIARPKKLQAYKSNWAYPTQLQDPILLRHGILGYHTQCLFVCDVLRNFRVGVQYGVHETNGTFADGKMLFVDL
jgi:hypothetical protein